MAVDTTPPGMQPSPHFALWSRLLRLVGLDLLRQRTLGSPAITLGIVDGPVLPGALSRWAAPTVERIGPGCADFCAFNQDHGTVVALMLGARADAPLPGLCAGCRILVRSTLGCQLDETGSYLYATEAELAAAIAECLDQGASIINLSLGLHRSFVGATHGPMRDVLLRTARQGAVLVWAAGNHPAARWPRASDVTAQSCVVPVAACDARGTLAPFSNVSPSIARAGLLAPGVGVPALTAQGLRTLPGGTSIAAPFVTAALALLHSLDPQRRASEVLAALRAASPARSPHSIVPPLLNASAALARQSAATFSPSTRKELISMSHHEQDEREADTLGATPESLKKPRSMQPGAAPQGDCGCGGASAVDAGPPVYAIGHVEARYPTLGIEKEVVQVVAREGLSGTDQRVLYEVLKKPHNKYLTRRLCWVLRIEGFDAYLLKPEDPGYGFDLLVESIKPSEHNLDMDLIIGNKTGTASPSLCNGAVLPIVTFDQLYSFEQDHFLNMVRADDKSKTKAERESDQALLHHLLQLADNTGVEDEHRALNYLTVRYAKMYQRVGDRHKAGFQLSGIHVKPSRISTDRKVMQVIFEYRNRQSDFTEKDYTRVDVTEKYPFLVSPLQPYYDRS